MSARDLVLTPSGLRFGGRRFACTIGRGGVVADKREGDGGTPAGVHQIVGMFYRPDRLRGLALPPWAQPILPGDLWSDDGTDPEYNQLVRAPHEFGHEMMRRADPLRVGFPTAGCVAVSRADLHWIAARVDLGARLIVR
jgi:L,D-peptidoglycan transpeptidase YkuD (ErfK/YbiS/YcfS/YnhG family)